MEPFIPEASDAEIRREKAKARELRRTQWWKQKLSAGRCCYCGRRFSAGELTMDHVVPLIRGGKSTKNNIVAACKECNTKKKYLLPMEWEDYLKKVHEDDR